jgi:hypothetical protein
VTGVTPISSSLSQTTAADGSVTIVSFRSTQPANTMTPQAMTIISNRYLLFRILKPSFFGFLRGVKGSKAAEKKQSLFQSPPKYL